MSSYVKLPRPVTHLRYVGGIADSSKNMGTTIYGMTAQYWKSILDHLDGVVGHPAIFNFIDHVADENTPGLIQEMAYLSMGRAADLGLGRTLGCGRR